MSASGLVTGFVTEWGWPGWRGPRDLESWTALDCTQHIAARQEARQGSRRERIGLPGDSAAWATHQDAVGQGPGGRRLENLLVSRM